ncbi:GTP cyclohydrolase II [Streptomyces sp. NPDC048566]|uniref:GTP cyclohydrolase II n=1 Tax=Streptomyces sp. NPDC048566 TaxID=3365569 RepID=UPI003718D673
MTDNFGVLGGKPHLTGVERVVTAPLPTEYGDFQAVGYLDHDLGEEQVVLVHGDLSALREGDVLTRLHSECLTGDAFGSRHCECGPQLGAALRAIVAEGRGVLVYLRGHEGRGIGLLAKLKAMKLQAEGLDTVEANLALGLPVDARDYRVAAGMLHDLGVRSVRLLSNNPRKRESLRRHGIRVAEQVPLLIPPCEDNLGYLLTKRERLDHHLPHLDGEVWAEAILGRPVRTVAAEE